MYQDPIAAIATPIGEGGIGVIRISGPDANAVAGRVFRRTGRGGDASRFPSHRLVYGHVVDPESGATLDEALAGRMPPPHPYTREAGGGVHCPGGGGGGAAGAAARPAPRG